MDIVTMGWAILVLTFVGSALLAAGACWAYEKWVKPEGSPSSGDERDGE